MLGDLAKIHAKTIKNPNPKKTNSKTHNVKTTAICRFNSWFDTAHQP